jgi:hypothetical protein
MISRSYRSFLAAALTGGLIWALSGWLTGHKEPWDATSNYYVGALLIGGCTSAIIAPGSLRAHYWGAFVGQLGYQLLFLRIGPLFPLGAVFLLFYCLIFLAAVVVTGRLRGLLTRTAGHAC